jgi:hypothetical protein
MIATIILVSITNSADVTLAFNRADEAASLRQLLRAR